MSSKSKWILFNPLFSFWTEFFYVIDDSEELILPGDKQELNEFIKSTTDNCKIQVEIFLPMLSVQLHSKHIYELIYNRINNDLLLWEPSAPKPKTNLYETPTFSNFGAFGAAEGQDVFKMCKSGIQYGTYGLLLMA